MSRLHLVVGIVTSVQMVVTVDAVSGQDYPNRLIRIITSGAGGGSDFASRQIGQGVSGPLGPSR